MVFSQQQMQDKTQGICEFTCHQDNYEPNTFHFWERYDTNRHMGQHMTQAPMQQFMEKVINHTYSGSCGAVPADFWAIEQGT